MPKPPPYKFPIPLFKRSLRCIQKSGGLNVSRLAKESDVTYAHTVKVLRSLLAAGLVENECVGRERQLRLTPKGAAIVKLLDEELKLLPKGMLDV